MGKQVNKRALAEILGLSERTLTTYQKDGLPVKKQAARRGDENLYDTADVIAWIVDKARAEIIGAAGDSEYIDFERERARLTRAQADKTELEVETLKKRLVKAEDVVSAWQLKVASSRAKLLAMPSKLSSVVISCTDLVEVEHTIKTVVYEALTELSGTGLPTDETVFNSPDLESDGGSVGAAAKPNSEPVGGRVPDVKRGGKRGAGTLAN